MTFKNSLRGRRNRQNGAIAERMAMLSLQGLGVKCAHLETGWRVRRVGPRIVSASPLRSVLADIVGVVNGRNVLCEVKLEDGDTLSLSRLEDHQRKNLTEWFNAGSIVLVAWVQTLSDPSAFTTHQVNLVPWPRPEWTKGHPLTINRARELHNVVCQFARKP